MSRVNNIPPEDRFTRTLFGVIMIAAAFFPWGRWVVMVLGILFLISAWQGYCVTCEMYKKFHPPTPGDPAKIRGGEEGENGEMLASADVHASLQNSHVGATQDYPAKLAYESIRAKQDVRPYLGKGG